MRQRGLAALAVGLVLVGCAASPPEGRAGAGLHECVEGEECLPEDPPVDPPEDPPVDPPEDPPACEPAPLALAPLDASPLDPAVADVAARCGGGFSWCTIRPVRAYALPSCLSAEPTLDEVVALALADDDSRRDLSFGEDFDRATLGGQTYFAYHAPGLLDAIDAFAGPGPVVARGWVEEIPCHNCHDYLVRYVLYYPDTRTVVVVDGSRGYDS